MFSLKQPFIFLVIGMEMGTRYNSSQKRACWEAFGKMVITLIRDTRKRYGLLSCFLVEDAMYGAAVSSSQLGERVSLRAKLRT